MAHFAQLDENNIVLQVIVVADSDAVRDASLPRSAWNEAGGIAFCKSLLGADTNWVQTSYNNNIRFRYASWALNTSTWEWEPPVALPSDKGYNDDGTEFVTYTWNEASLSWKKRTDEL